MRRFWRGADGLWLVRLVAVSVLVFALGVLPTSAAQYETGPSAVGVVQTNASLSEHLTVLPDRWFAHDAPANGLPVITVNDAVGYQKINGFGAAMTDSSAWLIERMLPAAERSAVMSALFGTNGIRLNFVRVPIGASDFTVGGKPYSYDDLPPGQTDPQLKDFSIAHDKAYILPALTQALAADHRIEFLASPWSPPAWMKGNDALDDLDGNGTLNAGAYWPWAEYIVKFIQAYAAAGVPIEAMTPANEPGNPSDYPGLNITTSSLAIWINQDLEPALARAQAHLKLYGEDYGWGTSLLAEEAISGPARQALSGLAWHCYFGSPDVMASLHQQAPQYDEIVDECSPGISAIPTSEVVISSLRDWASTVALWNLALDPDGGPVQQPNTGCYGCYGLVTINEKPAPPVFTRAFYQLGQASRFVDPGAQRVASNNFVTYTYVKPRVNFIAAGLDDVAFVNPDGTRVLIAYNNASQPITFAVAWHDLSFTYTLPAGAMVTFDWRD